MSFVLAVVGRGVDRELFRRMRRRKDFDKNVVVLVGVGCGWKML